MKKYNEIIEDIKNVNSEINRIESDKKENDAKISANVNFKRIHDEDYRKEMEIMRGVSESYRTQLADLKVEMQILIHNSNIALFKEAAPVICEIWNNYKAKPYGPKTKEKIRAEILDKAGVLFYMGMNRFMNITSEKHNLGDWIQIYRNVEGKTANFLSTENKIIEIGADELAIAYESNEYVDDEKARVAELKCLRAEAYAKKEELKSVCSEYNDLVVGKIESIYAERTIYKDF